jgi:hypothetical protein
MFTGNSHESLAQFQKFSFPYKASTAVGGDIG